MANAATTTIPFPDNPEQNPYIDRCDDEVPTPLAAMAFKFGRALGAIQCALLDFDYRRPDLAEKHLREFFNAVRREV